MTDNTDTGYIMLGMHMPVPATKTRHKATYYPFDKLEIHESFGLTDETVKFNTIKMRCYRESKKQGKVFLAVRHSNGIYVRRMS